METPLDRYRALVDKGELIADPVQELAAEKLSSLAHALRRYTPRGGKRSWLERFGLKSTDVAPPLGLYLFGGVGRGKSMLMQLFFDTAPTTAKERVHFQVFMRDFHGEIHRRRQLPMFADEGDPIPGMADGIADTTTLLCLDELEVRDIADAMIVGRLFEKLFERGVVVVATSNRHPDDLYKDGLQREKFLPFIALIKEKLDLLALDAAQDYRLGRLVGSPVYHTPLGPVAGAALNRAWERLTDDAPPKPDHLMVAGRRVTVPAAAHHVARFDFADLCEQALGPSDYIAVATTFETVIIDHIPQLTEDRKDAARRFVTLIDALYEHRTALICSAAVAPDQLYVGQQGGFEFHRTVSRLIEMQAADYLRSRHIV
ncbi:MAG: cell division protein ZapE [Rhodospirillaceae bacterium]|nr:MAG: cell division protein ZapE [Rhodospirillaceae bacterium]